MSLFHLQNGFTVQSHDQCNFSAQNALRVTTNSFCPEWSDWLSSLLWFWQKKITRSRQEVQLLTNRCFSTSLRQNVTWSHLQENVLHDAYSNVHLSNFLLQFRQSLFNLHKRCWKYCANSLSLAKNQHNEDARGTDAVYPFCILHVNLRKQANKRVLAKFMNETAKSGAFGTNMIAMFLHKTRKEWILLISRTNISLIPFESEIWFTSVRHAGASVVHLSLDLLQFLGNFRQSASSLLHTSTRLSVLFFRLRQLVLHRAKLL